MTPTKRITDPTFKYVPSQLTDILARFRAMGWVPPSERRAPCQ